MNALVGERMSIITHKPQTTRHRIIGIYNEEDVCQIVFSDTPGYVRDPHYKMHEQMNRTVEGTLKDADLLLFIFDVKDSLERDTPIIEVLKKANMPLILVLNKIDTVDEAHVESVRKFWTSQVEWTEYIEISALKKLNTDILLYKIKEHLPEGPAYYPQDQLTDRPERFFVSEIIREKILLLYKDEIPYSAEVGIEHYEETETKAGEPLARIYAVIYVLRETQKMILLGKGGKSIKRLGTESRKDIEEFIQSKVYLELTVKVRKDWRDDERILKRFGY